MYYLSAEKSRKLTIKFHSVLCVILISVSAEAQPETYSKQANKKCKQIHQRFTDGHVRKMEVKVHNHHTCLEGIKGLTKNSQQKKKLLALSLELVESGK